MPHPCLGDYVSRSAHSCVLVPCFNGDQKLGDQVRQFNETIKTWLGLLQGFGSLGRVLACL